MRKERGGAEKKRLVLAPSCFTREIYHAKMKDMIKNLQRCKDKAQLCPACAMFGTIGKDKFGKDFSHASRIRITDATLSKNHTDCNGDLRKLYMDNITLSPLSSPKLSNTEFYLKRPEGAVFWTYDYYIDKDGNIKLYEGSQSRPEINGRKFYWHNMEPDFTSQTPSNQNVTIKPLKSKVMFEGKVYFEKLSEQELNEMIYLLNAGEFNESDTKDIEKKKTWLQVGTW